LNISITPNTAPKRCRKRRVLKGVGHTQDEKNDRTGPSAVIQMEKRSLTGCSVKDKVDRKGHNCHTWGDKPKQKNKIPLRKQGQEVLPRTRPVGGTIREGKQRGNKKVVARTTEKNQPKKKKKKKPCAGKSRAGKTQTHNVCDAARKINMKQNNISTRSKENWQEGLKPPASRRKTRKKKPVH